MGICSKVASSCVTANTKMPGTVKMAAAKDGTVTAYQVDCYGTPGVGNGGTVNFGMLPYVYPVASVKRKHTIVDLLRLRHDWLRGRADDRERGRGVAFSESIAARAAAGQGPIGN